MVSKQKLLTLCLCAGGLTACISDQSNYSNFQSYYTSQSYQPNTYPDTRYYSQTYYEDYSQPVAEVHDSYYTGPLHSPTPHTEVDRSWVKSQNPKGYTIQLGESEKPSQIANKLYKAPKTDRSAEIKYNREGKTYYKGVYGSYNNYEDAQQALSSLPPEIKQDAGIKGWSSVQENAQ